MFRSVYRSRQQRGRRGLAIALLGLKHTLRGMLFIWPVYVAGLGLLTLDVGAGFAYLAILVPSIGMALYILIKGTRADYARRVRGEILRDGYMRTLILGKAED